MVGGGRRRRWGLALIAATSLAIALVGVGGSNGRSTVEPAADEGVWTTLPRAPGARREGLQDLRGYQVGSTVVVIAGTNYNHNPVGGLRYDLGTRRWRVLRSAPLYWRVGYAAAAAGGQIVVWGGTSNRGNHADGARYEVATGRWRKLPASPLRARYYHAAVSTGEEVLFFGGSRGTGGSRAGAIYRPASDTWGRIPPAPIAGRRQPVAVWSGREMIVWGGYARERTEPERFFSDGAAFDPSTGHWRRIADAPIRAGEYPLGLWTGDRLFVFNGSRAALYDPASDEWRLAAEPPLRRGIYSGAWTGKRVLVSGISRRRGHGASAAYDPARDAWTALPTPPVAVHGHEVALWTGESFFIWGACCNPRSRRADGAEYRPAAGG